jgi:hypothetical protein
MQIEFTQEGGIAYFPALSTPVAIDVDRLAEPEQEELKRLVAAAHFFELPARVGEPAKGAADYQYYILTIEAEGRRHTVRVLVPTQDPALRELLQAVQKRVKAAREAGRSGKVE